MKITKRQLREVIRRSLLESFRKDPLSRFGTVENFLQTVIWPCYQDGMSADECYRSALGTQEMQFLRRHREDILAVRDKPDFIAFAYEVSNLV